MHQGTSKLKALGGRLTYANVVASLALFIALGGTGYAVTALPRDSVGRTQLRSKAVGPKELAPKSVTSKAIRDRTIRVGDLSKGARDSLRGATGPAGPAGTAAVTLRASMDASGKLTAGNASGGGEQPGDGVFRVTFSSPTAACVPLVSLTGDAAGSVSAASDGANSVVVRTFSSGGTPGDQPFALVAAC